VNQYLLDIGKLNSFDEDDYIVTESNIEVIKWMCQWPNWGDGIYNNITFIVGEKSSGKTHLSQIWSKKSEAIYVKQEDLSSKSYLAQGDKNFVLEDVDLLSCEKDIFHFIEHVINNKNYLVITSGKSPRDLFTLPDLCSRLNSLLLMKIRKPDSVMVEQILVKYFSDRQISVSESVIKYLIARVDFRYKSISELVEKLDTSSLESQKSISIPFIKSILNL
jgi:chromosomal replication initiation ATPase DnaA